MKVDVKIRHNFSSYYQFRLITNDVSFFYNSSMSDELDIDYEEFKERLLKVIGERKILKSANEFVFKIKNPKELNSLVEDFKNEFVNELVALSLGGEYY